MNESQRQNLLSKAGAVFRPIANLSRRYYSSLQFVGNIASAAFLVGAVIAALQHGNATGLVISWRLLPTLLVLFVLCLLANEYSFRQFRYNTRVLSIDLVTKTRGLRAYYFRASVSKYIPGGFFHLVRRVAEAELVGISAHSSTRLVGLELLQGLFGGLACVLLSGLVGCLPSQVAAQGVLVASVLLAPTVFAYGVLFGRSALGKPVMHVAGVLRFMFLQVGANLLLAAVALSGLSALTLDSVLLFFGAFSVAWVIGFVTPGSPAGLGVRESMLLFLAPDAQAAATYVAVSIMIRISQILADAVSALAPARPTSQSGTSETQGKTE